MTDKLLRRMCLIMVFVSSFGLLAALAQPQAPPPPPPPPPPADDYFPKRWTEFSPDNGGFSVMFPRKPEHLSYPSIDTPLGKASNHAYGLSGVVIYLVGYFEFDKAIESEDRGAKALDLIDEGIIPRLSTSGTDVKVKLRQDLDGHPGRYYEVVTSKGKIYRMKYLVVGSRLYQVSVVADYGLGPNVMGAENGYEKISKAFLDSFKLLPSKNGI